MLTFMMTFEIFQPVFFGFFVCLAAAPGVYLADPLALFVVLVCCCSLSAWLRCFCLAELLRSGIAGVLIGV
tara:strand:+ start:1740 stop:1952 length:213 start_codon:yes stop_codon:yes gene_type:complete